MFDYVIGDVILIVHLHGGMIEREQCAMNHQ